MTTRFVALGIAPSVRETLDAAIAPLRSRRSGLAWTDPLGWHVTLAFLGRLPATAVPGIAAAVGTALEVGTPERGGLPRLAVGRAASFGGRVLVAEVVDDPVGGVAALGARVQTVLADAGFPVQARAVRPHLTIARSRRGSTVDPALIAETQRALDALPVADGWRPRAVGVYSSRPRSAGPARYVVDDEVPAVR